MQPSDTTIPSVVPAVVAAAFSELPAVTAVVLAGSTEAGGMDPLSDLDLYVYAETPLPLAARAAIADRFAIATRQELDNRYWEPGDLWVHGLTGVTVDLMYRTPAWLDEQLDRVLIRHEAAVGYSTAFWHNVIHSVPVFDRAGWYTRTQARAAAPYPEPLRRAIIAKNQPLLRDSLTSYRHQIVAALNRQDWLSVQHRLTAFLASYFDILFALNRLPHPGEKRQLDAVRAHGEVVPPHLAERLDVIISAGPSPLLLDHLDRLTDDLETLIAAALPPLPAGATPPPPADQWREWKPWPATALAAAGNPAASHAAGEGSRRS